MIKMIHFLLVIFGLVNCKFSDVVYTTKGPVQGKVLSTVINSIKYSSFNGIPYAEPPLGSNRFRPPIEKLAWSKTLMATKEGSNCMQIDFALHKLSGSEDCLYLNVYTPYTKLSQPPAKLKPVMVWIHGGSFKAGYGNSSLYGPDFFMEEDVVLVTFNYRIGAFGFLSLDHPEATGNAGLKDQNLVLKWVQQNIKKFGGNPKSVTLFGQSAGGVSVDFHSLSDMSSGLFHRSISMSSSPFCTWAFETPREAVKRAFKLGVSLGQNTKDKDVLLKTLYKASAVDIVLNTEKLSLGDPPFKPTLESPRIAPKEKKFMTQCYLSKYNSGNYYKVPQLMGFTSEEALLFLPSAAEAFGTWNASLNKLFENMLSIPVGSTHYNLMTKVIEKVKGGTHQTIIQETSNLLFVAGINQKLKLMQKTNPEPIYYYRLNYDSKEALHKSIYLNEMKGTAHGDDLAYLFRISLVPQTLDPKDNISIVRKRMVRMWANFAKFGNPTPLGVDDSLLGINWPATGNCETHLEISNKLEVKNNSFAQDIRFYEATLSLVAPIQSGCVSASELGKRAKGSRYN